MDALLVSFWDAEDTGFFYASEEQEQLIARSKEMFDGALPSPNGVAARVLVRLSQTADSERFRQAANLFLFNYRGLLQRAPQGTYTLTEAALLGETGSGSAATDAPVRLTAAVSSVVVAPGEHLDLDFTLLLASGYHVNSHHPPQSYLIPTTATVSFDIPASVGPLVYPELVMATVAGQELPVYSGETAFRLPVRIAGDADAFQGRITLTVRYQACTETACLAPDTLTAIVEIASPLPLSEAERGELSVSSPSPGEERAGGRGG
jgi:hypothetical protein